MLYMLVNVHDATDCAFRGEEEARHLEGAIDRFGTVAPGKGITIQGSWVNRPSHEIFMLLDAPGAHAVDDAIVESGLIGHSTSRVLSVIAVDDAVTPYSDAVLATSAGNG